MFDGDHDVGRIYLVDSDGGNETWFWGVDFMLTNRKSYGLFLWMREPDAAVREYETALALNPNFWDWTFSRALVYAGEPARALDLVQAHVRLDPFHWPMVHATRSHALYMLKRYAEAVTPLRETIPEPLVGRLGAPAQRRHRV